MASGCNAMREKAVIVAAKCHGLFKTNRNEHAGYKIYCPYVIVRLLVRSSMADLKGIENN